MQYAVKTGSQESKRNTREAIRNRVPFKTSGALRGDNWLNRIGQLYGDGRAEYMRLDRETIDYVVYSYDTPIAWHYAESDQWYRVVEKYSATTTTHQTVVSLALHTEL